MKLISFDLHSDFAFFRKPETNATINLSYNIIHKPALLGIFGAIVGLEGYKEKGKLPEYYERLRNVKVGVQPLNHNQGNYAKINIKYSNTTGYANSSNNFLTEELAIINPVYRVYILLNFENEYENQLYENIKNAKSEFIPYFGKNEFTAWWDKESYRDYQFSEAAPITNDSVLIKTLFKKEINVRDNREAPIIDLLTFDFSEEQSFIYFERLPEDFDLDLLQYQQAEFAYSNFRIKNASQLSNLYYLKDLDAYVQLH